MNAFFCDWSNNSHSFRVQLVLFLYRFTSYFYKKGKVYMCLLSPFFIVYRVLECVLGFDFSWKISCDSGIRIYHLVGIVVNPHTRIGKNCVIRQCTTLGARVNSFDAPIIGDNVDIGCNSVIIGNVSIGSGARIGAGSIVIKDVEPNKTVVGYRAR